MTSKHNRGNVSVPRRTDARIRGPLRRQYCETALAPNGPVEETFVLREPSSLVQGSPICCNPVRVQNPSVRRRVGVDYHNTYMSAPFPLHHSGPIKRHPASVNDRNERHMDNSSSVDDTVPQSTSPATTHLPPQETHRRHGRTHDDSRNECRSRHRELPVRPPPTVDASLIPYPSDSPPQRTMTKRQAQTQKKSVYPHRRNVPTGPNARVRTVKKVRKRLEGNQRSTATLADEHLTASRRSAQSPQSSQPPPSPPRPQQPRPQFPAPFRSPRSEESDPSDRDAPSSAFDAMEESRLQRQSVVTRRASRVRSPRQTVRTTCLQKKKSTVVPSGAESALSAINRFLHDDIAP